MWFYTAAIILWEMIALKQRTKNWFRPIPNNSATILGFRHVLNPKEDAIEVISDLDPV